MKAQKLGRVRSGYARHFVALWVLFAGAGLALTAACDEGDEGTEEGGGVGDGLSSSPDGSGDALVSDTDAALAPECGSATTLDTCMAIAGCEFVWGPAYPVVEQPDGALCVSMSKGTLFERCMIDNPAPHVNEIYVLMPNHGAAGICYWLSNSQIPLDWLDEALWMCGNIPFCIEDG
jgi:hypothetical protein